MTKAQAMKLARAKWGKLATLLHNPRACSKESRDFAIAALPRLNANKPSDPDGLAAWRKEKDALLAKVYSYPYEIGKVFDTPFGSGVGVRGSGDSWEEACRAAGLLAKGAE